MSNSKNVLIPSLSFVLSVTVVTWFFLVPLVNLIQLPLGQNSQGVISLASLYNISPNTDYLKYLILLLIPGLVAAFSLKRPQFLPQILGILLRKKNLRILTLVISTSWVINQPIANIGQLLTDTFHEGEYLGFLPSFLQSPTPFLETFFVHGFGLDVLPSLVANQVGNPEFGIAYTRFFVNGQAILSSGVGLWLLWEISQLVTLKVSPAKIRCISLILFLVLEGVFFNFDPKRSLFFLGQFALTIRWLRLTQWEKSRIEVWLLAGLIGVSIPLSFLYVYDRGIYFILTYIWVSLLTGLISPKRCKNWLMASSFGGLISALTILLILGWEQSKMILSQVLYWAKYGRYISFVPLPPLELTLKSQLFSWPMFLQSCVIIYLILDWKKYNYKIKPFVEANYFLLVLLLAAMTYMRLTLDMSDTVQAGWAAMTSAFLVYYLILLAYQKYGEPYLKKLSLKLNQKTLLTLGLISCLLCDPQLNPISALETGSRILTSLSVPDRDLLKPNYREAVEIMQPQLSQQTCFYSLTSEGVWYYLFNQPPCSQFALPYYAKPKIAQTQVVSDLEKSQPSIILFANNSWSNTWHNIDNADAYPILYQFVLQKYSPGHLIQDHWFWRRRETPLTFVNSPQIQGIIEESPKGAGDRKTSLIIKGWGILTEQEKPLDAVYLSEGNSLQLLAVSPVNLSRPDVAQVWQNQAYTLSGWSLEIPMTTLTPGEHIFKVWGYNAQEEELSQIGENILIKI